MRTLLVLFIASGFVAACRREPIAQSPRGTQIGQSTAPLPPEPVEPSAGSGSNEDHIPFNHPPDETVYPTPSPIPLPDAGVPQASDAGVVPPQPPTPPAPDDGGVPDDSQPNTFSPPPPGNP